MVEVTLHSICLNSSAVDETSALSDNMTTEHSNTPATKTEIGSDEKVVFTGELAVLISDILVMIWNVWYAHAYKEPHDIIQTIKVTTLQTECVLGKCC